MWTNFNNAFTVVFPHKLQKKLIQKLPPHLKSVAALPCEIRMFNCGRPPVPFFHIAEVATLIFAR